MALPLLAGAVPMAAIAPTLSFSRSTSVAGSPPLPIKSSSSSSPSCVTSPALPLIDLHCFRFSVYCGRGDKKTEKGKRFNHSFGNARPKDKKKGRGPPRVSMPPSAPKKDPFDLGQVVDIEIDDEF
ncbi:unnamed protein product [Cuscuta campestris]|uniref:30S ribosomal protein S31, chloroplastic n=1 Tax=Cuscuta campestris TaxID=132261 RepID=A0A484L960_9ASTE|nr:unnamed protein product [Cuscuta campestris]